MAMERKVLSPEEKEQKKRMNRWLKLRTSASELKNGFGKAPRCGVKIKTVSTPVVDNKKKKK